MSGREINTQEEFEALMREIDQRFQENEVAIQAREILALAEVAKTLGVSIKGGPLDSGPIPGVYTGDSLSAHIFEWIQKRYGERLRIDFSIGKSVILLRGGSWHLRFPLQYGRYFPVCMADLSRECRNLTAHIGENAEEFPVLNMLKYIEDLPQTLADELTADERLLIVNFVIDAQYFFDRLDQLGQTDELARSAQVNLNTAAQHCMAGATQHGLARWEALQACEKILKCFIIGRGETPPHTHDLSRLADQAVTLGLSSIDDELLYKIQCSPGIRYGAEASTLNEVVEAIHSVIAVGNIVLNEIPVERLRSIFVEGYVDIGYEAG